MSSFIAFSHVSLLLFLSPLPPFLSRLGLMCAPQKLSLPPSLLQPLLSLCPWFTRTIHILLLEALVFILFLSFLPPPHFIPFLSKSSLCLLLPASPLPSSPALLQKNMHVSPFLPFSPEINLLMKQSYSLCYLTVVAAGLPFPSS